MRYMIFLSILFITVIALCNNLYNKWQMKRKEVVVPVSIRTTDQEVTLRPFRPLKTPYRNEHFHLLYDRPFKFPRESRKRFAKPGGFYH